MSQQLNRPNHISRQDMEQLVFDGATEWSQESIEQHIESCSQCREQIMDIAASDQWRRDFSDSLSDFLTANDFNSPTQVFSSSEFREHGGDEFDLKSVEQTLADVLESAIHPEMLGRLQRYDIEGVIGCGGMGVVLRGFDRDLNRPVAIKMILPRLSLNGTAKQRFAREARAAAAVLHPNVIAIHGISETKGMPWFAMPLIAGPTLQAIVERNGPLPEREIVRIGMQIASGLAAAHAQGLVHRDVKPGNVMIDNQVNRVIITDFGLAQQDSEDSMTRTGFLAGTLNYMSPEQSRGEDIDGRSDLFSLGGLLFFLATGDVPFRAKSSMAVLHRIGKDPHPNVRSINPEISATLSQVIDRLLEKDASRRFQSASDVEAFLTDYLAHLHHPLRFPAPRLGRSKPMLVNVSKRGIAITAALVLTLVAVFTMPLLRGNSPGPQNVNPTENASLNWPTISERYDLTTPQEFEQDLLEIHQAVSALEQTGSINERDWFGNSLSDLSEVEMELRAFESQISIEPVKNESSNN